MHGYIQALVSGEQCFYINFVNWILTILLSDWYKSRPSLTLLEGMVPEEVLCCKYSCTSTGMINALKYTDVCVCVHVGDITGKRNKRLHYLCHLLLQYVRNFTVSHRTWCTTNPAWHCKHEGMLAFTCKLNLTKSENMMFSSNVRLQSQWEWMAVQSNDMEVSANRLINRLWYLPFSQYVSWDI